MTDFQKKLIAGLNQTRMTQKELAEACYSSEVTISRLLNGYSEPSKRTLFNIINVFENRGFKWGE